MQRFDIYTGNSVEKDGFWVKASEALAEIAKRDKMIEEMRRVIEKLRYWMGEVPLPAAADDPQAVQWLGDMESTDRILGILQGVREP